MGIYPLLIFTFEKYEIMKRFILVIFCFISCTTLTYSQISDSNTDLITKYFQGESVSQTSNSKNLLSTKGQRANSYISIVQSGEENSVYVNSLNSGDSQEIDQAGNNNSYEYYNYYSRENSSMQVNQEGTLNSLQVFGENSLMKGATINQKSNFESIVVKNYTN